MGKRVITVEKEHAELRLIDNVEDVIYQYFMSWSAFDKLSASELRNHAHALSEKLTGR